MANSNTNLLDFQDPGVLPHELMDAHGESLEDAVCEHPSLLLQNDEADTLLTSMLGGAGGDMRFKFVSGLIRILSLCGSASLRELNPTFHVRPSNGLFSLRKVA